MNITLQIVFGVVIAAIGVANIYDWLRVKKDWCPDCRRETTVEELKLCGWRCGDCRDRKNRSEAAQS